MTEFGLCKKLGLKSGMTVLVADPPDTFIELLTDLPDGVIVVSAAVRPVDCVISFVRSKSDVEQAAKKTLAAAKEDGLVWFGYPKKSSKIKSDITRDTGWEPVHKEGFDSVAQVSIDETWTGFRFREKRFIKFTSK